MQSPCEKPTGLVARGRWGRPLPRSVFKTKYSKQWLSLHKHSINSSIRIQASFQLQGRKTIWFVGKPGPIIEKTSCTGKQSCIELCLVVLFWFFVWSAVVSVCCFGFALVFSFGIVMASGVCAGPRPLVVHLLTKMDEFQCNN